MQRVLSTRFPTLVIHPPREVRTPDNARNKDEVLKEVRGLFKDETRRVNQVGINQALHLSRIPFSLRTFPLYYESARQGTYQYRTLRKHTPTIMASLCTHASSQTHCLSTLCACRKTLPSVSRRCWFSSSSCLLRKNWLDCLPPYYFPQLTLQVCWTQSSSCPWWQSLPR